MIGKGYVIDHCVSLFNRHVKDELYRGYIADSLKLINDNLAKSVGGNVLRERYSELARVKKEPEKTGDEIARDVIRRAGLKVKNERI